MREKIHPTMLVVTIRKDEDRGISSTTLRELWRIINDQIKEQAVVVVGMSKHSVIWRRTELRSVMRENQLKYIDVEEMRVVTNSKHVAEQIRSDRDKCVVMDNQKIKNLKSTVMDGVNLGKLGNGKIPKLMRKHAAEKKENCAEQS